MNWINKRTRKFLENGYLQEGVTAEERIREIAESAEGILKQAHFADKFYDYMSKGFYSLSSPVWSNFGNDRGLPISCFGSYIEDDMASIMHTTGEVGMMSKYGGGTSGYFGDLRPAGAPIKNNGRSSGAVHFVELFDKLADVVSQGSTRRGSFSPYLPVSHGDIMDFLDIGGEGSAIQKMTTGVTVTDERMQQMDDGDLDKRKVWSKVLKSRSERGYPYILYTDNVNNNTVDCYKGKYPILASNLCSEIMLPSNEDWSFVCNLSSMNIAEYDKWKDTDAVETLTFFLDAVMTEFIDKVEDMPSANFRFMERAYNFAKENRALGIGVLGWHTYLQNNMLAFNSQEATNLNKEIFSLIKDRAYSASETLAKLYGEPKVLEGYGRRNATLLAVAPTTSSAYILGQVSQSIEPIWSNYYVKTLAKDEVTITNPALKKLLREKGLDTKEVWDTIRDNDGSVSHMSQLSVEEKAIFRTYGEINVYDIINQASDRQKFIDQGQSLNVLINPETPTREINALYLYAWRQGIKALYYQHSLNSAQVLSRKISCHNCEA